MKMLLLLALTVLPMASVAAAEPAGDPGTLAFSTSEPAEKRARAKPSLRVQRTDEFTFAGARERQSSIVAGMDVSPNLRVGIGLFDKKKRKSSLAPDPQLDPSRRGGKRASIGFTLRF